MVSQSKVSSLQHHSQPFPKTVSLSKIQPRNVWYGSLCSLAKDAMVTCSSSPTSSSKSVKSFCFSAKEYRRLLFGWMSPSILMLWKMHKLWHALGLSMKITTGYHQSRTLLHAIFTFHYHQPRTVMVDRQEWKTRNLKKPPVIIWDSKHRK